MRIVEILEALGHRNIVAENKATFEITKEAHLSKKGDCIVGIRASKGACELSEGFKRLARRENARITVIFQVDNNREVVIGRGSSQLTFKHPTDLVARKSSYICGRTLMIKTNKTAADLSRHLIENLKKEHQKMEVILIVDI
ncbi:DUF371 domain-containing protein [Candidatus Bathyarchaeota archaeon]|nr:MAG: DUF371 domain-containing protein [Candidatus Bathyarchaeota archaeon]